MEESDWKREEEELRQMEESGWKRKYELCKMEDSDWKREEAECRCRENQKEEEQAEMNKIILNLRNQYKEKVEQLLKRNEDGVEINVLNKLHQAIVEEIMELLEMDLKSKIRQNELMENYKKNLQAHIDSHWTNVVVAENSKNIRKKQREENEKRERKREEARQQLQQDIEANERKKRAQLSCGSPRRPCSSNSLLKSEDTPSALPPLIFHLQSSRVVMAMDQGGRCEILNNEFGENETPAVVIVTPDDSIVYGSEALGLMSSSCDDDTASYCWSVANFFLNNDSSWNKNVCIDGNDCTITTEFLLGFLLKKLKQAAEESLGGSSNIGILVIPIWLSSTQRIRVKDAAEIAGFTKVYLVNEASAAACNFALGEKRPEGQGDVLVVTENFDRVDAFVYTYNRTYEKKVEMIAHSTNYEIEEESDTKGSPVEAISKAIRRVFYRIMSLSSEPVVKVKVDNDKVTSSVRRACKRALDYASLSRGGEKIEIDENLIITENPIKWKRVLETVVRNIGRKAAFFREETAVICGSTALSKNPVEIGEVVRDKLAFNVSRRSLGGGDTQVINKNYSLPVKVKNAATTMPPGHNETKFYQTILGNQHMIGALQTKRVSCNEMLVPNFYLTNEGIVTLNSVMTMTLHSGIKCRIAEEQIQWITSNLSRSKIEEQSGLMIALLRPPPPKEGPVFTKTKMGLVEKCLEMEEKLTKNQFKIKSGLVKNNVPLMISEARRFGEHENVRVDGIRMQMGKLPKLCEK